MTNADKIKNMPKELLAKVINCPKYLEGNGWKCAWDGSCSQCKCDWLSETVKESTPEPQKPSVPKPIDRPNFESQLTSYSIRAFVQQFKYLASKINEIIKYLQEAEKLVHKEMQMLIAETHDWFLAVIEEIKEARRKNENN